MNVVQRLLSGERERWSETQAVAKLCTGVWCRPMGGVEGLDRNSMCPG